MSQAPEPFSLQLAPAQMWQSINPWIAGSSGDQIGLFNISLGHGDEDLERKILAQVGSYGRQLGHLADALDVVIGVLNTIAPEQMAALSQPKKDALAIALGDIAQVRQIKAEN